MNHNGFYKDTSFAGQLQRPDNRAYKVKLSAHQGATHIAPEDSRAVTWLVGVVARFISLSVSFWRLQRKYAKIAQPNTLTNKHWYVAVFRNMLGFSFQDIAVSKFSINTY